MEHHTIHSITKCFERLVTGYGWALLEGDAALGAKMEKAHRVAAYLRGVFGRGSSPQQSADFELMADQLERVYDIRIEKVAMLEADPTIPILTFEEVTCAFDRLVGDLGWAKAANRPLVRWQMDLRELQLVVQDRIPRTGDRNRDLATIQRNLAQLRSLSEIEEEEDALEGYEGYEGRRQWIPNYDLTGPFYAQTYPEAPSRPSSSFRPTSPTYSPASRSYAPSRDSASSTTTSSAGRSPASSSSLRRPSTSSSYTPASTSTSKRQRVASPPSYEQDEQDQIDRLSG